MSKVEAILRNGVFREVEGGVVVPRSRRVQRNVGAGDGSAAGGVRGNPFAREWHFRVIEVCRFKKPLKVLIRGRRVPKLEVTKRQIVKCIRRPGSTDQHPFEISRSNSVLLLLVRCIATLVELIRPVSRDSILVARSLHLGCNRRIQQPDNRLDWNCQIDVVAWYMSRYHPDDFASAVEDRAATRSGGDGCGNQQMRLVLQYLGGKEHPSRAGLGQTARRRHREHSLAPGHMRSRDPQWSNARCWSAVVICQLQQSQVCACVLVENSRYLVATTISATR